MYDRTPTDAQDLEVGMLVVLNGTSTTITGLTAHHWAGDQIDITHTYGATWRRPTEKVTVLTRSQ